MQETFIPMAPMRPDLGPGPGDHMWYNINLFPVGEGAYTGVGRPVAKSQVATATTSTDKVWGTHTYDGAYSSLSKFVLALDTKVYIDSVDESIVTGYTNSTAKWGMQFATYGPYVLATNRNERPQFFDVTSSALFANFSSYPGWLTTSAAPCASAICTYKNHVILGNIKVDESPAAGFGALLNGTYPSLIWWSGTDLPFYYSSPADDVQGQFLGSDYRQTFDGGGEIVKLVATDSCVYIFKTRSIMRLDGPPFQVSLVSNSYGCSHPQSITSLDRRVYFVSQNGPAYIDVDSNQIVNIAEGSILRSLGRTNGNYGYTMPVGPKGVSTGYWGFCSLWGTADHDEVSAAADPYSKSVVFYFRDGITARTYGSDYNGSDLMSSCTALIYSEKSSEWTLWAFNPVLSSQYTSTKPYVVCSCEMYVNVMDANSSVDTFNRIMFLKGMDIHLANPPVQDTIMGIGPMTSALEEGTSNPTITTCTTFKMFTQLGSNSVSRVTAIRPIWFSEWNSDKNAEFKTRVYTITKVGTTNWFGSGRAVVADSVSSSLNGWLAIDGKWGEAHAIALSMAADQAGATGDTEVRSILGFLVRYETGSSRSA